MQKKVQDVLDLAARYDVPAHLVQFMDEGEELVVEQVHHNRFWSSPTAGNWSQTWEHWGGTCETLREEEWLPHSYKVRQWLQIRPRGKSHPRFAAKVYESRVTNGGVRRYIDRLVVWPDHVDLQELERYLSSFKRFV